MDNWNEMDAEGEEGEEGEEEGEEGEETMMEIEWKKKKKMLMRIGKNTFVVEFY